MSVSRVQRCASPTAKPLRGRDHEFESKRLKLYGPSLTEVCTGSPGAIGCVGPCALCLGSVAHARSVVFCQPMTALTCTAPEGYPKVTPWEQFPRLFHPSRMAWLTTEGLGRCGIVCYARVISDGQALHADRDSCEDAFRAVKSRVEAVASREDSRNASCGSGKRFYAF